MRTLLKRSAALRRAMREIVKGLDPHHDRETGGDLVEIHDCFCARCLAVRALRDDRLASRGLLK